MNIEWFDGTGSGVSEQAAEWLLAFEDGQPGEAERRQFLQWLKRSPEHIEAFLQLTALHRQIGAAPLPQSLIDRLVAEARDARPIAGRIPPAVSRGAPLPPPRRRRWPIFTAAAAMLLLLIGGLLGHELLLPGQVYRSGIGEQRSIALADGSVITLNTQSRVRVRLAADERRVVLLAGEALFDVARDARRPFRVSAGDLRVHVLGTRFTLYRRGEQTQLTVIEGRVGIETGGAGLTRPLAESLGLVTAPTAPLQALGAGEQLLAEAGRPPATRRLADPERATAWTARRLIFEDAPLAEVVAEFNRYNRRQIHVDTDALATRRITGVFKVHDIDLLVGFLQGQHDLRVIEARDDLRVVSAAGAGGG